MIDYVVAVSVAALVGLIIIRAIKKAKNGNSSSCGCGCDHCSSKTHCNQDNNQ